MILAAIAIADLAARRLLSRRMQRIGSRGPSAGGTRPGTAAPDTAAGFCRVAKQACEPAPHPVPLWRDGRVAARAPLSLGRIDSRRMERADLFLGSIRAAVTKSIVDTSDEARRWLTLPKLGVAVTAFQILL